MNLPLGLASVLIAGDHFYLSLSLLSISMLSYLRRGRFAFARGDLVAMLLIAMVAVITIEANTLISLIYLVALIWFARGIDNFNITGFSLFTKLHLSYAYVLFIETIITNGTPISPQLFCFYGERSAGGCHVASYMYGNVGFPRLYGFASEPASYGFFLVLNMFAIIRLKLRHCYRFIPLFFASLVLTFSFSAMSLFCGLLILSAVFRKQFFAILGLHDRGKHFFLFFVRLIGLVGIALLGAYYAGLMDVLLFRTVARFSEVLAGQDFSSLLRLSGTWSPVYDLLQGDMRGKGIIGAKNFIDNRFYIVYFENVPVEITGQRASALAYIIVSNGVLAVTTFLLGMSITTGVFPLCIFLLFLFTTSYPLTAVPFVLSALLLKNKMPKLITGFKSNA